MSSPFYLVPWQNDFFAALYDLLRSQDPNPGNCLLVFPSQRPRRYLLDHLKRHAPKPLLLPAMLTATQLFARCAAAWAESGPQPDQAGRLDRVALLAEALRAGPESRLARLDMRSFFPWGLRLADLLEEMFQNLVEPVDIAYAESEVEPFAAQILAGLGGTGQAYQNLLRRYGLTTPGLEARRVAILAEQGRELPHFLAGRTIILAGFVRLNRAEDRLFHRLWQDGAKLCLHSDPKLAIGRAHWSCQDLDQLAKSWQSAFQLLGKAEEKKQERHFYAGYDLHSQLSGLGKLLEQDPEDWRPDSRAIVLPDAESLLPVLHSLPDKEVNIALGFPLERTLMARFVEQLLRVSESALPDGRVHWRALLHLLRHPYLRMLRASSAPDLPEAGLRPFFQAMEQAVRNGPRLPKPQRVLEEVCDQLWAGQLAHPFFQNKSAAELHFFTDIVEEWLRIMLEDWRGIASLAEAARALRACCQFLIRYGGRVWQAFPLDSEAMFRILSQLAPQLENCRLASENLGQKTVFTILRQLLGDLRVAFEADPLSGLQILGLRETRLLRFKQAVILDLTEDNWPGTPSQDPLLPDNLRKLLDLPSIHARDRELAHDFHRLAAGADDLHLFWQEGLDRSGLLDAKKVRSRFVEDLIWQEENKQGILLQAGQAPLTAAAFPLGPPHLPKARATPRSPDIQERLLALLRKPISATWLDAYLTCPLRFYQEKLCALGELPEVREGDDPPGLGSILHAVLQRAHAPYLGGLVRRGDLDLDVLLELYRQELQASDLPGRLPAHSLFMLEQSVPLRLKHFLLHQPEAYRLLHLEDRFSASLSAAGLEAQLFGRLDRVDLRERGIVILDYKSGKVNNFSVKTWQDEHLWRRLAAWEPDGANQVLADLAARLPSLQLPLYLFIFARQSGHSPLDAAWVELAGSSLEKSCLGPDLPQAVRAEILEEKIPLLLGFVLRHLLTSPDFLPQPGRHCAYCPFKGLCPPPSALNSEQD